MMTGDMRGSFSNLFGIAGSVSVELGGAQVEAGVHVQVYQRGESCCRRAGADAMMHKRRYITWSRLQRSRGRE
jgi:hypothetical protein